VARPAPVRIKINHVPVGVGLAASMMATEQIADQNRQRSF